VLPSAGLLLGLPSAASGAESLPPLDDPKHWQFRRTLGEGDSRVEATPTGPVCLLQSSGSEGMAGFLECSRVTVTPGYKYVVRAEIRTEALEPITARHVGMPYVRFWDAHTFPGGHQPVHGVVAPRDSGWHEVSLPIIVPTTARQASVCCAFGAYGRYEGGRGPRESGRARGSVWVRNIRLEKAGPARTPLPSTIRTSDAAIQQGADVVANCLHNASLSGEFIVSDGYTLSGNIVPDLSFGLFGVRRLAHPEYIDMYKRFWRRIAQNHFSSDGAAVDIRVMAHLLFPLGVDEIFSFSGDWGFLEEQLPIIDTSFDFVRKREDEHGLVRLVAYGQWRMGQGADWVDWYPTRMEGKTFNFHQWYIRALRRAAMLHRHFAARGASRAANERLKRAASYEVAASRVERALRSRYWSEDHFVTNIDYRGKLADEKWLDDQVWSIRLGIADGTMTQRIWRWIDSDPEFYEGVPTRWTAFAGPRHGMKSWFGRLGAGDILARYSSGNPQRGYQLLRRISDVFSKYQNVYEAYDMYGEVDQGTSGWGNYTEHSGGYVWALSEGPFGLFCDSDEEALATVAPRFPPHWRDASIVFMVRGTRLTASYRRGDASGQLTIQSSGAPMPVRVMLPDGASRVLRLRDGSSESWPLTFDRAPARRL
jgi:hypothetical protein